MPFRPTTVLLVVALTGILAACAPAPFRNTDAVATFVLTVDGAPVPVSGDGFDVRGDGYVLHVLLAQPFVNLAVGNRTASVLRVLPAASGFVLADGTTAAAVTGAALRGETGVAPIEVEAGEEGRLSLIPGEGPIRGGDLPPMFPWPLTGPTTVVVTVALEVEGATRLTELVFSADGPSER